MSVVKTTFAPTADAPSASIFGNMALDDNPDRYTVFHEDGSSAHTLASSGETGKFYAYLDSGNTVSNAITVDGGGIVLTSDGTDNDGPILTSGGSAGNAFIFAAGRDLAFEARVKINEVTNKYSLFVGLGEEGLAVDNGIFADTQVAVVDKDWIGFYNAGDAVVASLTAIHAGFKTESATAVVSKSTAHTMVLDTFVKLGFYYNSSKDRIYFYVNGVKVAGQTTAKLGTTGFPDGQELAVYLAIKEGSGNAHVLTTSFVKCAVAKW